MMTVRRATVVLLLATACRDVRRDRAIVTDSSGVQITRFTRSVSTIGSTWTVAPEPVLDIGVQEGESAFELDRVVGARRLSDGSIVIADGGSGELRLFDSGGRFIRSMGGKGAGPGEFQSVAWVQVAALDTVLVVDSDLRRVTAFTPSGALQWTTLIEGTGYAWPGNVRLPDGTFVLLTETGDVWQRIRSGQARAGQTARNTAVLARYAPSGVLLDTLGRFRGYEEAILERDGRPATTYPPWGRLITHSLGKDRVYVGTQESAEVRAYLPDGTLAAIIRWPAGDLDITTEDIDEFNAVQFELAGPDSVARQAIVARTKSLPLPDARPAYGRVLVDEVGLLWISEPHIPIAAPRQWTAIQPGRGVAGRLEVPGHFDVYEIGLDYLLGRWTDEIGVQHVRILRLYRQE